MREDELDYSPGSVGGILQAIRGGGVVSRSSLARATGLAPSTVSLRVDALIDLGLVREGGEAASRGGRRPREVSLDPRAGFVAAAEFGARHVRLALSDATGGVLIEADSSDGGLPPLPITEGPEPTARALWDGMMDLAARADLAPERFLGAAIGIPAPVEYRTGRVTTPSFMPSWHGIELPRAFAELTDRPIVAENDANLIALSETVGAAPGHGRHLFAVKLGSRIGSGLIWNGRLYRGFGGAAGEMAHTGVFGEAALPCTCPVPNCLEAVAGGGALVSRLRNLGFEVESTADVVELGAAGVAEAVAALRGAGARIGEVIGSMVNLLNPREVVLAGTMSQSTPLVAAIKAEVFQRAIPTVTEHLQIQTTRHPRDAGIIGATELILGEVLAPSRINALAASYSRAAS
ncbi:ROK family transcriptional regulator [Microbacterium oryzae]|uniref:ROK family transcriptional regulator n=1 Tax=Microbacterium oryzae TaxID=743009 RepID=UPI0025B00038|nr:ROK family transcriptional regulator [Microbacterium oryzae]MDN3311709.1 ROK family transcriptional regulator [Microbacterium oryzae]